jgi:putative DNA methylase
VAPDVPLVVAPGEHRFSTLDPKHGAVCPHCGHAEVYALRKGKNKKVELSLLVHPQWFAGSPKCDANGHSYGGCAQDNMSSTVPWDQERASRIRLLEVRGPLPDQVTCPDTQVTFATGKEGGTVPKKAHYACGLCGTEQNVLATVKATGKTGPTAAYAVQCFSPKLAETSACYNGRFFAPYEPRAWERLA